MFLMHMTVCASVPTVCAHVVVMCICCVYVVYMLCICCVRICCVYVVYMLCVCVLCMYIPPCVSTCVDLDLQKVSSNNGSSIPLLVTEVGAPDVHRSPNGSVSCSNRSRCSRTTAVVCVLWCVSCVCRRMVNSCCCSPETPTTW